MDSIQLSTLAALAGKWQTEADCGAGSADRRAALRECADTVRMLCEVRFEDCPHAAPHRYCAECPVSPCPIALGEHAVAKRGAVPEGYDIAPTFRGYAKLGSGRYVLHNCPRTDEDHPSLVIAIATEEEKAGRQVGELRQSQPGLMIQPERIAVRIDFKSVAALDALEQQLRFLREDSFPDSLATPAADQFHDAAEMVPEFSDSARAALLWVLWHHQGGSSPIGQPIRFALGIGQHERLSDWQVAEAKRWGELRGEPKTAKCDGNHGGPRCADPECWNDGPIALILDELRRAVTKFPTWPTDPLHALAVLGEEFGELTKATLQTTYEPHKSSHDDVRTEAVQTAAMALRFIISLERYEYSQGVQHQQEGQPA